MKLITRLFGKKHTDLSQSYMRELDTKLEQFVYLGLEHEFADVFFQSDHTFARSESILKMIIHNQSNLTEDEKTMLYDNLNVAKNFFSHVAYLRKCLSQYVNHIHTIKETAKKRVSPTMNVKLTLNSFNKEFAETAELLQNALNTIEWLINVYITHEKANRAQFDAFYTKVNQNHAGLFTLKENGLLLPARWVEMPKLENLRNSIKQMLELSILTQR